MEVLMVINIVLDILDGILKGIIGVVKFGANMAYKGAIAIGKTAKFLYKASNSTESRTTHKEYAHICKHTHNTSRLDTFK